jgi:O-antigen/teichoic acid export membrane protein
MNKIHLSYFLGLINLIFQIIQNIVIVPLILSHWGKQNYELIILFSSFLMIVRSLNTGFSTWFSSESFKLNKSYEYSQEIFVSSSVKISLLLGAFEFLFIFFWAKFSLNTEISTFSLLFFLFINSIFNVIPNLIGRLLLVENKYNTFIYFGLQSSFFQIVTLIFLIQYSLFNLSEYLFITSLPILLHNFILFVFIKLKFPSFLPRLRSGKYNIGLKFFYKSILVTINNFLEQFNLSIIILLMNKLSAQNLIAQFNTIKIASNTTSQLQSIILNPHLPNSIKNIHIGKWDSARKMFRINNLWTIIITVSFLILFDNYFEILYDVWLLKKIQFNKEYFHLIFLSILLANLGKPIYQILQGLNKNKQILIINLIKFFLYVIIYFSVKKISLIFVGYVYLFVEGILMVILPLYFDQKISNSKIFTIDFFLSLGSILILAFFYFTLNFNFNLLYVTALYSVLNLIVLLYFIKNLLYLKQFYESDFNEKTN